MPICSDGLMFDFVFTLQRWIYGAISGEVAGYAATQKPCAAGLALAGRYGVWRDPRHDSWTRQDGIGFVSPRVAPGTFAWIGCRGFAFDNACRERGGSRAPCRSACFAHDRRGRSRAAPGGYQPRTSRIDRAVAFGARFPPARSRTISRRGNGRCRGWVRPCLLTLFVMFFASNRGVPEAGLTFAFAMMLGVALILSAAALTAIAARDRLIDFVARRGAAIGNAAPLLDGFAGSSP